MSAPPDSDSGREPNHSLRPRRTRYRGTHPRKLEERYKEKNLEQYPELAAHLAEKGRTPAGRHLPIMVAEVLDALRPAPNETVADLTVGYGGHAAAFLERTAPNGRLIGLDLDGPQLAATGARLALSVDPARLHFHNSHFAGLPKVLGAEEGFAKADGTSTGVDIIFADLGVSNMQIDDPQRGFSYKHDGPLDMRMNPQRPRTAADVLRTIAPHAMVAALRDLSDEPEAERVAEAIIRRRSEAPITRTGELAEIVLAAKGHTRRTWAAAARAGEAELHPAARTFQALRILVNDELQGLEQLLRIIPICLNPVGRVGFLTFHSGEDRRVKHALLDGLRAGIYSQIADEPIRPGPTERHANPRSTSAKLRWAVRCA
jgi:16S rRNA (cytosine1402-N4)-methyltransferase